MAIREAVLARRAWFVPGLVVYGLASGESLGYLVAQQTSGGRTIFYGSQQTGDSAQIVSFSSLTDHRGNQLPETINAPRVIIRPRSAESAFLLREESGREFAVARDPLSAGPVTVDLLILEMGS